MLAYVFWHWKKPEVPVDDYEKRQRAFHAALAAEPAPGYHRSFSAGLGGAPWAADGGDAYEDWYLVEDFASLGTLNDAAVAAGRAMPHDAAAIVASGGAGAVYALKVGSVGVARHAVWFGKPPGMRYDELFARLGPVVEHSGGAVWMRQMVLGPATELCLRSAEPAAIPSVFDSVRISLRPVWPE